MTALPILALLLQAAPPAAAGAAQTCDRQCMRVALDRHLAAMVAHDAKLAPLAPGFRATENGAETSTDGGLWKSAAGFGPMQRRYFDPVSHQAAFYGAVYEAGGTAMLSVRVRFEGAQIVESEAIVARKGEPLHNPMAAIADQPRSDAAVPIAERSTRDAMQAGVGRYFDAIAGGDYGRIPHVTGCSRVENGTRTTSRGGAGQGHAADEAIAGDCAAKPRTGSFLIKAVAHRRYPVIDTEAGVILGVGLFQRPPGATWRDGSPRKRNLIHEYFACRSGRIAEIFAVMRYREPEEPDSTGWPD